MVKIKFKTVRCYRFILLAACFATGCNTLNSPVDFSSLSSQDINKTLRVKTIQDYQILCLERTSSRSMADEVYPMDVVLNDLCRSYQNRAVTKEQYRAGILAAPSLLVASEAGRFIWATDIYTRNNNFSRLALLVKNAPRMKELCSRMTAKSHQDQPALRLCRRAFDKS